MWQCVCKEAAYIVWSSESFMSLTPAWTFLKQHDAVLSSLIGSTSHHLHPLSSFFFFFSFYQSNVAPTPVNQTAQTCVSGLKTCNKMRERAQIEFQDAEDDSLGYHLWMICILWPAEGGVLVTRGGWWSFAAQRSLDGDLATFFPQALSLRSNGDVIPTRVLMNNGEERNRKRDDS